MIQVTNNPAVFSFLRSVSIKYGKPTELPVQYEPPKLWQVRPQNIPQRKEVPAPPLHEDEDDRETGDDEEDVEYDEGPKEGDDSRKRRWLRVKRNLVEQQNSIDRNFCAMSSCLKIACTIGRLSKDEEVSVIFPAIAWARTIRKVRNSLESPTQIKIGKLIVGIFLDCLQ